MEATLLEAGKTYIYKRKKEVVYKHQNLLDRNRYIFLGKKGGEVSLSLEQVTKYIREIKNE